MIQRIDHLVLTVRDIEATCDFYRRALNAQIVRFGEGRTAIQFEQSKINLHQAGKEFEPKAAKPTPGSGDLCLSAGVPISEVVRHLQQQNIVIEEGPVQRTGALGPMQSIYIRDPDQNLVEISHYVF